MSDQSLKSRKAAMPPKLDAKSATERVHFVAPNSLLERVAEWRSQQRPIPSLSQAIRRLVEERLEQYAAEKVENAESN